MLLKSKAALTVKAYGKSHWFSSLFEANLGLNGPNWIFKIVRLFKHCKNIDLPDVITKLI